LVKHKDIGVCLHYIYKVGMRKTSTIHKVIEL